MKTEPILTARLMNEFVYCPRLFYYEAVEGVFEHNTDTLQGAVSHKRVNAREDSMPAPAKTVAIQRSSHGDSEPEVSDVIHSRSVSLYSERLGITAKLDLVESQVYGEDLFSSAFKVCPVEYKKGKPYSTDDGISLWPADRIQLGLQILLLRENGYTCEEGILYYQGTRQRVPYILTPEDEVWIHEQISQAREVCTGPIPEPLDHSPKCPRCSLVGICLPDESHCLASPDHDTSNKRTPQLFLPLQDEPDEPQAIDRIEYGPFASLPEIRISGPKAGEDIRRLIAPNPETKALYLNTPGHYVGKKGGEIIVKEEGKEISSFRVADIHHVALFGPVQVSTAVVQTLCENGIPLSYFSMGGWFYGLTRGHSMTNVFTRIEQFKHAADHDLALIPARLFIYGKIRNQRTLLMRNHIHPDEGALRLMKYLASASLYAPSLGELLGIEGSAAGVYFSQFPGMLKPGDEFSPETPAETWPFFSGERNRRPPRDPVNALLSLGYSLLAKDCTLAAYAVGFDPYVGFLHQPRYGKPALALDLMEEFRPLVVDSVVITLINNRMLGPKDFVHAGDSVSLSSEGRKTFFLAYEKRMGDLLTHPIFGYKVCYRRAIELQARMLAKYLTDEIEQYVPLMTR